MSFHVKVATTTRVWHPIKAKQYEQSEYIWVIQICCVWNSVKTKQNKSWENNWHCIFTLPSTQIFVCKAIKAKCRTQFITSCHSLNIQDSYLIWLKTNESAESLYQFYGDGVFTCCQLHEREKLTRCFKCIRIKVLLCKFKCWVIDLFSTREPTSENVKCCINGHMLALCTPNLNHFTSPDVNWYWLQNITSQYLQWNYKDTHTQPSSKSKQQFKVKLKSQWAAVVIFQRSIGPGKKTALSLPPPLASPLFVARILIREKKKKKETTERADEYSLSIST